jgi:hypothetical protein
MTVEKSETSGSKQNSMQEFLRQFSSAFSMGMMNLNIWGWNVKFSIEVIISTHRDR